MGYFMDSTYNTHIVCARCRIVSTVQPSCGHEGTHVGSRWRAPKKSDDKAWKRIENGDWWWDDKAIYRWMRKIGGLR